MDNTGGLVIACQQCSRTLRLPSWLPFGPDDQIRHAFCGEECRNTWWANRPVHRALGGAGVIGGDRWSTIGVPEEEE